MDVLPTDVTELILRKLAEQDPASLLRAKCACNLFLSVAPTIPWRDYFLASYPAEENALGIGESKVLDGEVASKGGYKQLALVKARYRWASKQHNLILKKYPEKRPTTEVEGAKAFLRALLRAYTSPPKIVARYLFLFKLRGKTLSGTFLAPEQSPLGRRSTILNTPKYGKENADVNADVSVPVTAVLQGAGKQLLGDAYETMMNNWISGKTPLETEGRIGRRVIRRVLEERVSDLEIFAFLSRDVYPEWEKRECKPWDFCLSIRTQASVYKFPVCRAKVQLVSPERDLNSLALKSKIGKYSVLKGWILVIAFTVLVIWGWGVLGHWSGLAEH